MSNFHCEKCGKACIDSPIGYVTGCEHYPADVIPLPAENEGVEKMLETELRVNAKYKGKTGNIFLLFRDYNPNSECFQRLDSKQLHYGREFIEFENGIQVLDLEEE